jgi:hypothetical protein
MLRSIDVPCCSLPHRREDLWVIALICEDQESPFVTMTANLDVDLESGLASEKIQHPPAAVVHKRPSKRTRKSRPIPPRLISKTGMPVISAGKTNIFVVLISLYLTSMHRTCHVQLQHFARRFPTGHLLTPRVLRVHPCRPLAHSYSIICDVIWWKSNKAPLHHQFLVVTVAHQQLSENGSPVAMYDIYIERAGKAASFRGTAVQKITIAPAQPTSPYQENCRVLFGLIDAVPPLRRGIKSSLPGRCGIGVSAFEHEMDVKWCGPPAALWRIARYMNAIVNLAPQYRLASTNC